MSDEEVLEPCRVGTGVAAPLVAADELIGNPERAGQVFNAEYFRVGCGPFPYERSEPWWGKFFGSLAEELIRSLRPDRVLDAGCALGFLVEAFWDRGIQAYGVDVSPFAIAQVRRDLQPFCRVGSLADGLPSMFSEYTESRKFDLVTCIEVLEHMPEPDAVRAVANLTDLTDTILFSSTPSDVQEATHFNVKPLIYWLQLFQQYGFSPDLEFDASFVSIHAMLLRRRPSSFSLDVLRSFATLLTLRQTNSELQGQVNTVTQQCLQAETALSNLQAEHSRVCGEQIQRTAALTAELHTVTQQREVTDQDLAQANQTIEQMQRELSLLRAKHAGMVERQTRLEHDRLQWDAERRQWQAERIHRDAEEKYYIAELRDQYAELSAASQSQQTDVRQLQAELAVTGDRIVGVEQQVRAILNSRIWKWLVRGGHILLRLQRR